MSGGDMRPNIRVEIHNNLMMEVDDEEEGEILDDLPDLETDKNAIFGKKVKSTNDKAAFSTGINIFEQEEQQKLVERAKRFSLRPEEIRSFTEGDLQQLHHTLGINPHNESDVRFDAVHMLGTDRMSMEDILDYFSKYAPSSIEFVGDNACNVLWLDAVSAARAIYYSSRVVKGMPVRAAVPLTDDEDEDILRLNEKINFQDCAQIEDITIAIPPGFWRLGDKHPNSKCILLRYALKTDRQPFKTESFQKHYKKLGNKPTTKKGIFDRNTDLSEEDKNPWGTLAQNWDEDYNHRELARLKEPKTEIKGSLLLRLGQQKEPDNVDPLAVNKSDDDDNKEIRKKRVPRMRMYADEEEEKQKRRKLLQTLKKQSDKLDEDKNDLRNMLGIGRQPTMEDVCDRKQEQQDLGLRLRNRNKSMVFALDGGDKDEAKDVRSILDRKRSSPKRPRRPIVIRSRSRSRSRSPRFQRHSPMPNRRGESPSKMYSDRLSRRRPSHDSPEARECGNKPKSKVAVVIKTQKKPAVASTIWSRVARPHMDSDKSESASIEEESSSSDSSEEEIRVKPRIVANERPGFNKDVRSRLSKKPDYSSPLKIEFSNN